MMPQPQLNRKSIRSLPVDRYGFFVDPSQGGIPSNLIRVINPQKQDIRLENARLEKWCHMLANWKEYTTKKQSKLKQRIRKGIPDAVRGEVWPLLLGSSELQSRKASLYQNLLHRGRSSLDETIGRDINRTFPKHVLFCDAAGEGQKSLFRVLHAYSLEDGEVGYCQGMGFISALALSYIPEDPTFYFLYTLLNNRKHNLRKLYLPGMGMVHQHVYQFWELMKIYCPKIVKHFDGENMHPTMFATQWFVTIFLYSFPFHFVARIWDAFLNEGWKIVFRVAIAIMKVNEKKLLSMDFEQIMNHFRSFTDDVDLDGLMTKAFSLSLSIKKLNELEQKYYVENADQLKKRAESNRRTTAAAKKDQAALRRVQTPPPLPKRRPSLEIVTDKPIEEPPPNIRMSKSIGPISPLKFLRVFDEDGAATK